MSATITPAEEAQLQQTIEMFRVITQSQPLDYQSLEILKEAYSKLGREDDLINTAKRIAQELVVNEKVGVIGGFGLTPLALATAQIATQSKTPMVVMAAATAALRARSGIDIARQALLLELIEVFLPQFVLVLA